MQLVTVTESLPVLRLLHGGANNKNVKQFRCFSAPILDLDSLDSTEKEKHVFSVCECEDPPYLVSSGTSTSVGAVMGALECPAVGSSVFSSPFVELITCTIREGHQTESS